MALNFIYPMNEVIHRRWVRLFGSGSNLLFTLRMLVFSNTEMSLKEELVYTPEEGSSQPVLISRSSMVLKSD